MRLTERHRRTPTQQVLGWRIATATRVFTLAIALGQMLSSSATAELGVLFVGLAIIAVVASVLDFDAPALMSRLIPMFEGILAAALLLTTTGNVDPLVIYLAAPIMIGGVRGGWVGCLNAALAIAVTTLGVWLSPEAFPNTAASTRAALPWMVVGLGAGLLAAAQTRSIRRMEEAQAPYLAAHRIMTQLHAVSQRLDGGLDTETVAGSMLREVMTSGLTQRAVLFAQTPSGALAHVASDQPGALPLPEETAAAAALAAGTDRPVAGLPQAFPVVVGDNQVGVLVVTPVGTTALTPPAQRELRALIERHGVGFDTALLFDDIRAMATAEERQRLARDIHDGVAQDIASLGYVVDELAASTQDPAVRETAATLRGEVTRVVSELRHSVFDLRSQTATDGDLGQALREYVQGACQRNDLLAHCQTSTSGNPLSGRIQGELMWIVQEAMANIRKHAPTAENVWLTFETDGVGFHLSLANDADASITPQSRVGHYGLQTMRERAARVNASLELRARPEGGTVVLVTSPPQPTPSEERAR